MDAIVSFIGDGGEAELLVTTLADSIHKTENEEL